MIADFILNIPSYILTGIVSLLPLGGTVPVGFTSAVHTVWSDVNAFSFIVPVNTLLQVLVLAFAYNIGIFTFKIIHWIITKIPFVG